MDTESLLRAIGMSTVTAVSHPAVYAELLRVARRLREADRKVVALLPASAAVAAAPVALQLGLTLADVAEGRVAVVDANTRLPAWGALAAQAAPAPGLDDSPLTVSWIADRVSVMTPATRRPGSLDLELLEQTLHHGCEDYCHVLVDLTGFAEEGEHWAAFDLVDGVLVVGQAGISRERELVAQVREVPASLNLGTLLVG